MLALALKQTRLVTADVATLIRFYESDGQAEAAVISSGYVEFDSEPFEGFALVDPAEIRLCDGVVEPGANRSMIFDFEFADVPAEYERLQDRVTDWVMTLITAGSTSQRFCRTRQCYSRAAPFLLVRVLEVGVMQPFSLVR